MKKVMVGVIMAVVFGSAGVVFACSTCGCQGGGKAAEHDHAAVVDEVAAPVNAGNKFCPIMGGPVTSDSPAKVEYKGKLYNLCCPGCSEAFLKDPEAALKNLADTEVAADKKQGV